MSESFELFDLLDFQWFFVGGIQSEDYLDVKDRTTLGCRSRALYFCAMRAFFPLRLSTASLCYGFLFPPCSSTLACFSGQGCVLQTCCSVSTACRANIAEFYRSDGRIFAAVLCAMCFTSWLYCFRRLQLRCSAACVPLQRGIRVVWVCVSRASTMY